MPHSLHYTNAMFGMNSTQFWRGPYTRANTESYKDLRDKNRGVQEGQYFTVSTGTIFYGIYQSMRLTHSDTYSVWCLEYIKIPADVGATFAYSSSDNPFKQSNILKKVSN